MSLLFSLTDSNFYLPFKCDESLNNARRVLSIDTLTGRESRDLGHYPSDTNIDIKTLLSRSELDALFLAYGKGIKVGLSFSVNAYEGFIQNIESVKSTNGKYLVKIIFITTGAI